MSRFAQSDSTCRMALSKRSSFSVSVPGRWRAVMVESVPSARAGLWSPRMVGWIMVASATVDAELILVLV